jgi:hypothetical protein
MHTFVVYMTDPAENGKILFTVNERLKAEELPAATAILKVPAGTIIENLEDMYVDNGVVMLGSIVNFARSAAEEVDERVSNARALYVTNIVAQEMIYLRKEAEARAYLSILPVTPVLADYPFIEAESNALNESPTITATRFRDRADGWVAVGAALEGIRVGYKTAIQNATDATTIRSALSDTIAAIDAVLIGAPPS